MVSILFRYFTKFKTEINLQTLKKISVIVIIILVLSSRVILLVEPAEQFDGFSDAFWWAIVTATTVGYGDKYPVTFLGRIIALLVMMLGIGSVGAITAKFADIFINLKKRRELGEVPADYEGHLLVCGWCAQAQKIITEILNEQLANKQIVLVAEKDRDPLPNNDLVHFVRGQIDKEATLKKAGIKQARRAIILNEDDNDRTTVLSALTVKNLNPDLYTVAEVSSKENEVHLKNAGVDEVIIQEEINSRLLVRSSFYTGTSQLIGELLSNEVGAEIYMRETGEGDWGQNFITIVNKYKEELNIIPIALKRDGKIMTNPEGHTELKTGDKLVYIGGEKK
jgi:voltage-gated potassium channel